MSLMMHNNIYARCYWPYLAVVNAGGNDRRSLKGRSMSTISPSMVASAAA